MRYVAFDVETPNRYNNRMSAIGIAVVEDGRIVAVGSHQELLSACPAYARMVELQRLEDESKE